MPPKKGGYMATMTLRKTKPSIEDLQDIVGRLSEPDKMPGFGFALPSSSCRIGQLLKKRKHLQSLLCRPGSFPDADYDSGDGKETGGVEAARLG